MPGNVVTVHITGTNKVSSSIRGIRKDIKGRPFERNMKRATRIVKDSAHKEVPVDKGALKASIADEVYRAGGGKVVGVIGSNVHYSPFVEYGARAHWPPPGALLGWANRHGWSEYDIRYHIATLGTSTSAIPITGTQGFFYLHRALEKNEERIVSLIGKFVSRTINRNINR